MRSILLDWLKRVFKSNGASRQTLHLSAQYIDRFLSKTVSVTRNNLQLVACAAGSLAFKMQERELIGIKDWAHLTDDAYTANEVLKMEATMVKILEWNLYVPTSIEFVHLFCKTHNTTTTDSPCSALDDIIVTPQAIQFRPSVLVAWALVTKAPSTTTTEEVCNYLRVSEHELERACADLSLNAK
jgi:hypothetical protein